MKLTNEVIKRIIKQELNNVLKEMRFPDGHPDHQFLIKVRRDDAGIDSMFQKKIEDIEKEDPKMAGELAKGLGSQENLEVMPDDPENIMQLKNEIVDLQLKAREAIWNNTSDVWRPLVAKLNKKLDELSAITGEPVGDIDNTASIQTDFHRKHSGESFQGPHKVYSPDNLGPDFR
tara:strand:- start:1387 stop:1911 length:525 start_codon:yes stop_codon:yes gene_type:complete